MSMGKIIVFILFLFLHTVPSYSNLLKSKCFIFNDSSIINFREERNLYSFIRLTGYIKYFHPSDQAIQTNWTNFLIDKFDSIILAKNDKELANQLYKIFYPVSPLLKIVYNKEDTIQLKKEDKLNIKDRSFKVIFWQHSGGPSIDTKYLPRFSKLIMYPTSSKIVEINYKKFLPNDSIPNPNSPFHVILNDSIICIIPVALFKDKKGSYPHISMKESKRTRDYKFDVSKRSHRVAAVATEWNIVQHFYPYYEETKLVKTWDSSLIESLREIWNLKDSWKFSLSLYKLGIKTNDGHSGIVPTDISIIPHSMKYPDKMPTLNLERIENKTVITEINDSNIKRIVKGDIIYSIDGISVDSLIKENGKYTPAAIKENKDIIATRTLFTGNSYHFGDSVLLRIIDSTGNSKTFMINTYCVYQKEKDELFYPKILSYKPIYKISMDGKTFYYLNLTTFKLKAFKKEIEEINKSDGLILDMRYRPSGMALDVLKYLTKDILYAGNWFKPVTQFPDHIKVKYEREHRWKIKPAKKYLNIPKVLLSSYRLMSYGETCLEMVDYYHLATIIGEKSAGTNGDITCSSINTDYCLVWTGMKVLKRDGSYFHGVGIDPNIKVGRTILGVRESKDEILNRALKYLSEKI